MVRFLSVISEPSVINQANWRLAPKGNYRARL